MSRSAASGRSSTRSFSLTVRAICGPFPIHSTTGADMMMIASDTTPMNRIMMTVADSQDGMR
jgi:hypothetical protein